MFSCVLREMQRERWSWCQTQEFIFGSGSLPRKDCPSIWNYVFFYFWWENFLMIYSDDRGIFSFWQNKKIWPSCIKRPSLPLFLFVFFCSVLHVPWSPRVWNLLKERISEFPYSLTFSDSNKNSNASSCEEFFSYCFAFVLWFLFFTVHVHLHDHLHSFCRPQKVKWLAHSPCPWSQRFSVWAPLSHRTQLRLGEKCGAIMVSLQLFQSPLFFCCCPVRAQPGLCGPAELGYSKPITGFQTCPLPLSPGASQG